MWQNIKTIFVDGAKVVVGAAKAAWAVLKFAVKAAVWVVAGIFTIAGHLASYVGKTLSKLSTPKEVVVVPPKKVPALVRFLEDEAAKDGVIDDNEVMVIKRGVEEAAEKNQAMVYTIGEDTTGDLAVSDPEFIAAKSWDKKIDDANNNNQIYTKRIRIAS